MGSQSEGGDSLAVTRGPERTPFSAASPSTPPSPTDDLDLGGSRKQCRGQGDTSGHGQRRDTYRAE